MDRTRSTRSGSAPSSPPTVATSTGNSTISATSTTLGVSPNPNQITRSGASTIMGIVWLTATSGYSTWRARRNRAINTASATPTSAPITSPRAASPTVVATCPPSRGAMSTAVRAMRPGDGST